jgi:prepilin-type N-terminal cleavage/methylation domain-containing protein
MLITQGRRGFTLVEIMVSITMMLIVSGAAYQTLALTQRLSGAQGQQVNVQGTVRSAALVLANEFRPLGTGLGISGGESDLVSMAPTGATYRAERGFGLLCQTAGANRLQIRRLTFAGHREPQAGGDSISVFVEGNPAVTEDDVWVPAAIIAVSVGRCAGGDPSIDLIVTPISGFEGLPSGTPIRIHEVMELRLYRSEGRSWLGMRSVSSNESIQPLSGPLRDGDGIQFDYLAATGRPTGVRSEVRGIRFTLHGESEAFANFGAQRGQPVSQDLSTFVGLRNAVP